METEVTVKCLTNKVITLQQWHALCEAVESLQKQIGLNIGITNFKVNGQIEPYEN